MIKVMEIKRVEPYAVECKFNNGISKVLDVYPLIQNHKDLVGIDKLLEMQVFSSVRVGEMGELVWDNIIKTEYNGETILMNYDISPEFAFIHAK